MLPCPVTIGVPLRATSPNCFLGSLSTQSRVWLTHLFDNYPFCLARNSLVLITIWIAHVSAQKFTRRALPRPFTKQDQGLRCQPHNQASTSAKAGKSHLLAPSARHKWNRATSGTDFSLYHVD